MEKVRGVHAQLFIKRRLSELMPEVSFSFLFLLEISVLSTENAYLDFCPDSVLNFFPCLRARVCKREAR